MYAQTKKNPLVSIITVVYNGAEHLEQTIQSVLSQNYQPIEYIIIDGGSTDGTLEIIKRYAGSLSYWKSEPDHGIYDAMNKGIQRAHGELIGIINSGDWYEPHAVKITVETLDQNDEIVYGMLRMIHNEQEFQITRYSHTFLDLNMIPHPSSFITKTCYELLHYYDDSYRYSADYDFMLKASRSGIKFKPMNHVVANFRLGGLSSTPKAAYETLQIKRKYGIRNTFLDVAKVYFRLVLSITTKRLLEFKNLMVSEA